MSDEVETEVVKREMDSNNRLLSKVFAWVAGIGASLLVVGIGYLINASIENSKLMAVMEVEIKAMRSELHAASQDRYTAKDHSGYAATVSAQMVALDARVARLERKVD